MHAFAGGGVCLLEASCCSTKYGRFVTLTELPNIDLLHSNTITRFEALNFGLLHLHPRVRTYGAVKENPCRYRRQYTGTFCLRSKRPTGE
jgi:hypothetical protein